MTITLLAPDGVPVTAKQERQAKAALYGNGSNRALGGRSGFRVGTPSSVFTVTSTTWTLSPCSAMIDPAAVAFQGMYGWATDAALSGGITAADAVNPRRDLVYIQIDDPSAGDGTGTVSAQVKYLAGTPAVDPAAPALPVRSFEVGQIAVPKAGGGSPTAALNTARFVAAGGILPVYSLAERDALDKHDGLAVRRMDLPRRPVDTYDGAAWNLPDYYEASAAITTFGPGWTATAGHAPRVYRYGNRVHLVGAVTIGSGADWANMLTIPAGFLPVSLNTTFVGSNFASNGTGVQLAVSNTKLVSPDGYRSGTGAANGVAVPIVATWTAA